MDHVRAPGRSLTLRCARAVGVSSLAWAVASPAHVLAGGSAAGSVAVTCLVLFTAWPLVAVLGGAPSRTRMVLVLLTAQGLIHVLMELLASQSSAGPTGPTGLSAGLHDHSSGSRSSVPVSSAPVAHVSRGHEVDLLPSPAMIVVHLVAALVLGLVLVHGEGLLRSTLGLLAAVMLPIATVARTVLLALRATAASVLEPGRIRPARMASRRPDRHVLDVVARRIVRRGPPALA